MPSLSHIHLIAPSYSLAEHDVELTKAYFENLGMQVTVPPDLLGKDLLCANKDGLRLAHLDHALNDSSADIIWLLQGGYGLTRLIHRLLSMEKPQREKLFIGCSDGTALHVFLNQVWNWQTLHGPSALTIAEQKVGTQTIEAVLRIAKNGFSHYTLPTLKPFNAKSREINFLEGTLVGGNLCLLQCSVGTNWQFNPSDKILFFEDIDERGYRVDRMLMHLQQANTFDDAKAIIFGDFVAGNEADGTSLVLPVIERFADNIHIPVFSLPGCGHGAENFPLPFNTHLKFEIETVDWE
ncbi:MAG: LD-carboxypeptidase [Alphaproteobacteria bacterium]|nr:LD-carboxypeptidase [Alphaproteobacteria bacterium]